MRAVIFAIIALVSPISGSSGADRWAFGHTVYSRRDPHAQIRLPDDVRYVGTDRFVLSKPDLGPFDVCELYVYANAGRTGSLRELYWVQFEHYLPAAQAKYPQMHYTYASPHHVMIAGMDFYVDTDASDGTRKPKSGSDTEHFYTLLAAHGYRRTPMMFVRLVHLMDAERKELMIIAGEDLPAGLTVTSLKKGGAAYSQWPGIERGLVDWAVRSVDIRSQGQP